MNVSPLLAALTAAALSPVLSAEEAKRLDTVQVTASRALQPIRVDLASSTVLDRTAIVASQAPDLIDLLARQPGVDVSRVGGPGSASTLFLRGGNSNHALVLVDGVRVNSAQQGLYDFAHLPLERIERIEIIRGPRAALWGSDALAGVIQIFTRDPGAHSASLQVGSLGRYGTSGQLGWQGERASLGVGFGHAGSRGINASLPGSFGFDPDLDGYRNDNLALAGRTDWGQQHIEGRFTRTLGRVQFDQGQTDARSRQAGVGLGGALAQHWLHQISLGDSSEDLLTQSSFGNRFTSRRQQADWLHDLALGTRQALLVGINLTREEASSRDATGTTVYAADRDNTGIFIGWRGRHAGQRWELVARHDDNSQFGTTTTASAAWGWTLGAGLDLRANWGQGFRAPSTNELYSPGFGGFFAGNPALRPERSSSREVALAWTGSHSALAVSLYRSEVAGLIQFAGPLFRAGNVQQARLEGFELGFDHGWEKLQLSGNLGWQDARNALTGQPLLRRAARSRPGHQGLNLRCRCTGALRLQRVQCQRWSWFQSSRPQRSRACRHHSSVLPNLQSRMELQRRQQHRLHRSVRHVQRAPRRLARDQPLPR